MKGIPLHDGPLLVSFISLFSGGMLRRAASPLGGISGDGRFHGASHRTVIVHLHQSVWPLDDLATTPACLLGEAARPVRTAPRTYPRFTP